MEVLLETTVPREFEAKAGTTYETRFVYMGFSRLDTEARTLSRMKVDENNKVFYFESEFPKGCVIPRAYHTELARVTVYSKSPRIWKEELAGDLVYFFRETQQQLQQE
jgi:hypothetical protein